MFRRSHPALEELNVAIAPEQLQILKNQLESESPPSPQSLFNYAWGLLKTPSLRSQKQALGLLAALYRDTPALRREALYYLALGSVKTGEFADARRYADALVEKEPDNAQFKALRQAIDDQVTQDGLIGLGIAGGVLAVGLGVLGAMIRKKR
ncbi:mitochondrial fission 1 protein [Metschnikowia bicuspidata var. bicuspidata NRRL YB-4993]|uniref:Mitochondrial fission 1 protein n=1 Tax=Metschnikowia bicuspidata var. bicuspidata NRRL YB-4993 TaxID=869754 RepID=A0A1A0HDJ0_9ASCO|nr:mitochondrial fission 1 protein [Metschnikowia bicuspidata var. bicuspidata NRRL YB-4993]OBA21993.1 mitochondrial fission 1 protein [Metschnikowia bicuspidata var. bicuspidata NRRL YB-4993]